MILEQVLPQFATPIAATGFTSIAFALEALLQAAAENDHLGDSEDAVQIPVRSQPNPNQRAHHTTVLLSSRWMTCIVWGDF